MTSKASASSNAGTATGRSPNFGKPPERAKACPDCAGNGMICDYTGEKFVQKVPCERCFGTGLPAWMIRGVLNKALQTPATGTPSSKVRMVQAGGVVEIPLDEFNEKYEVRGGLVFRKAATQEPATGVADTMDETLAGMHAGVRQFLNSIGGI